jgi:hypothetical protein
MHLDKRIAFTAAGFIVAAYGWYIRSSPRQRYISATFPIIFEIVEWFWLLRYPLPSWIDPAAPMYRFASLPISTSALYWLIHILIPGGCILGAVWCLNRLLSALGIAERWPALEARSFVH